MNIKTKLDSPRAKNVQRIATTIRLLLLVAMLAVLVDSRLKRVVLSARIAQPAKQVHRALTVVWENIVHLPIHKQFSATIAPWVNTRMKNHKPAVSNARPEKAKKQKAKVRVLIVSWENIVHNQKARLPRNATGVLLGILPTKKHNPFV